MKMLVVFVAGGAGSVLRMALMRVFPEGTLWAGSWSVNALGCLMMGMASARISDPLIRAAVLTGGLGGFTTFSAFSLELSELTSQGKGLVALGYAVLQVAVGLGAVMVGARI